MKNILYKFSRGGLFSILCIACFSQQAWAEIECESMTAEASLNVISPVGPIIGIANFLIDDKPSTASVVVNLIAPPEIDADGTQHILSRLDYDFGGGDTIIGVSTGALTPTGMPGIYSNTQKVTYIDGTGKYENVVSRIHAQGDVNFLDNTATQQGVGDLCISKIKMNKLR